MSRKKPTTYTGAARMEDFAFTPAQRDEIEAVLGPVSDELLEGFASWVAWYRAQEKRPTPGSLRTTLRKIGRLARVARRDADAAANLKAELLRGDAETHALLELEIWKVAERTGVLVTLIRTLPKDPEKLLPVPARACKRAEATPPATGPLREDRRRALAGSVADALRANGYDPHGSAWNDTASPLVRCLVVVFDAAGETLDPRTIADHYARPSDLSPDL